MNKDNGIAYPCQDSILGLLTDVQIEIRETSRLNSI